MGPRSLKVAEHIFSELLMSDDIWLYFPSMFPVKRVNNLNVLSLSDQYVSLVSDKFVF